MKHQKTLQSEVNIQGIGLHLGKQASLTIKPAPANHGIVFIRTDLKNAPTIEAHYSNVVNTQLATTLGVGNTTVSTVEHLMAALYGMGVDNALIEVDGPEVPILDGSSELFVKKIKKAGLESQLSARTFISIKKRVELKIAEKWALAEPSENFEIHGSIEWDHPSIGYQEYHYIQSDTSFNELADARTFGFLREVEFLKSKGLIQGGSLENAIVLDNNQVLNPEGLRSPDELVRHKILDAIGDFALAGIPILGKFKLHRAGHEVHAKLLAEILKDSSNYELIQLTASSKKPSRDASYRARVLLARASFAAAL